MKALCAISSIEFNIEHFPGYLSSREVMHPVFYLPQHKLLSYLPKWAGHQLTEIDSYLLFLALLNSSNQVEFRIPVFRNEKTNSIVASNMEHMAKTISKINAVLTPSFSFPRFAVTSETRYLSNVHHWLESWDAAYDLFKSGKGRDYDDRKIARREQALEILIKSAHRSPQRYATSLADWAVSAGSFPTFILPNPFSSVHEPISCTQFWHMVIRRCAIEDQIFSIDRKDIIEILEHCEEHISMGSIFSNALFKILRNALEKQKNFLGGDDISLFRGNYTFVSNPDSIESANIQAMIDAAPSSEPIPKDYPTKLAYLRAKMRWEMAKASVKNLPDPDGITGEES